MLQRDNYKLLKGLFYLVITVLSLLVILFMEKEDVQSVSETVKKEITRFTHMQVDDGKDRCNIVHDDITVITGHFSITSEHLARYGTQNFAAMDLSMINNPIVGYFDNKDHFEPFQQGRLKDKLKYMTKVEQININKTWAYQLLPHVMAALSKSMYPKSRAQHNGAQIICNQHLKYELVYKTVKENPFCTKYFAWIDLDVLKNLTTKTNSSPDLTEYNLYIPNNLEENRIAFFQSEPFRNLSSLEIFKHDKSWICQDVFFGEGRIMAEFVITYMKQTLTFLYKGLAGQDRNVLYAMNAYDVKPDVKLQVYEPKDKAKKCSDLALLLKASGQKKKTKTT